LHWTKKSIEPTVSESMLFERASVGTVGATAVSKQEQQEPRVQQSSQLPTSAAHLSHDNNSFRQLNHNHTLTRMIRSTAAIGCETIKHRR
jgi:hypothetical protein